MVSTTRPGPNTAQEPEKPGDYVQTGENQGLREGWSRERERQKDHDRQRDQKSLVFGRVLVKQDSLLIWQAGCYGNIDRNFFMALRRRV